MGTGKVQPEIVIVGAGHAGVQLASSLRQGGWVGGITLLDSSARQPYERPQLSKDFLDPQGQSDIRLLRKKEFYAKKGISLRVGTEVVEIDRRYRTVVLNDGSRIGYDKLALVTGARARLLTVPGSELLGTHSLRTLDDAERIRPLLGPGKRLAIVGGGYIGLEVASAAVKAGCTVTLLEGAERLMSRVTSPPVSRYFQELHEENGVRVLLDSAVAEIRGTGSVESVVTSSGEVVPVDGVIFGIGVTPNEHLAQDAGIACNDGILVDDCGRSSDPDIYAAGDVARFRGFDGRMMRLECIQNASDQANAIAAHMISGRSTEPALPWFWTVQHGVRLQSAGLRSPQDDMAIRRAPNDAGFSVLYFRDRTLAAIDTVDCLADFAVGKKLIASKARIDPGRAADPAIKLKDIIKLEAV